MIGKPNVGKSTLLNQLVREKLAAISNRPQTTRTLIRGVCHLPGGQIVFLDTPGIHQSAARFNQCMVKTSLGAFAEVDVILFLMDAESGFGAEDEYVLQLLAKARPPVVLVLNKIDLVPKGRILVLIDELSRKSRFEEIIPVSAMTRDGLDLLQDRVMRLLPEGPAYYPEGMVTDCPEEFLAAELIREKIIRMTHMELPFAVAVVVEGMRESEKGVLVVDAMIYAEKTSQRGILIGKEGAMLKKIGTAARQEIEKRFGGKCYLNLHVKVKKNWRTDERSLRDFGYLHDSH